MTKSILLIGNTKPKSSERFLQEAQKVGVIFNMVSSQKLSLTDGEIKVKEGEDLALDILDYDTYFFWSPYSPRIQETQKIAQFLYGKGKRIVEKTFVEHLLSDDKVVPESVEGLYKVPQTEIKEVDEVSSFPVVVKTLNSRMGRGVYKVDSQEQLHELNLKGQVMVQEYYEIEYDTRVLVVGGEIVGGFDRYKKEGERFLTTRPGGLRQKAELSEKQKQTALEATRLKGLELAGVDMFVCEGEIYVIEVNAFPQFRVFERVTGVNIAKRIIEYLLS
jgi:hypothetical protein